MRVKPTEKFLRVFPMLSIIIPANNEAAHISACLGALLASDNPEKGKVEIIVVANACNDSTAEIAQGFEAGFQSMGWSLVVLDIEEGGKINALNTGDAHAQNDVLIYLDADVVVGKSLLKQLHGVLDTDKPVFASGSMDIQSPPDWFSRAYRRIYARVPFMQGNAPGCGLFAVNAAGRKRWDKFPDIISDDTFVRLQFRPNERIQVAASYQWPIVAGYRNLVKVRHRQNAGVVEIKNKFPQLFENEDKPSLGARAAIWLLLSDPLGLFAYGLVALSVRLKGYDKNQSWSRGR